MASSASAGAASGADVFADISRLEDWVRGMLVTQLKATLKDINWRCTANLRVTGNKPELTNRIIDFIVDCKRRSDATAYAEVRKIVNEIQSGKTPSSPIVPSPASRSNRYPSDGSPFYPGSHALGGVPANKLSSLHTGPMSAAGSSIPYNHHTTGAASSSTGARAVPGPGPARGSHINFRPSPFWEIKQFVSPIVVCSEAAQHDKRCAVVTFRLSNDAQTMLSQKSPSFQVRLFSATQEAYYAAQSGRHPAPVEFPLTCEAKVNGVPLSISLKGSKKTPGRVPPPDLNKDKALFMDGRPNRIELNYINAPKRHCLIAALCEAISADTLVERIRRKKLRTKEEVVGSMKKAQEDDDIQAGAATMSLKCPLSYMRMTTPCRSIRCTHIQCFDAQSFFSVNEQTPSWLCPVCNKILVPDEVIMDGYVHDVIKRVPDTEDTVIVEPDGSWHTQDGNYTSAGQPFTSAGHSSATELDDTNTDGEKAQKATVVAGGNVNLTEEKCRSASPKDVLVLEDNSPSPPHAQGTEQSASDSHAADSARDSLNRSAAEPDAVIDLTLSSDDEAPPPPPRRVKVGSSVASSSEVRRASLNQHVNGHGNNGSELPAFGLQRQPYDDEGDEPESPSDAVQRPGKRRRLESTADAAAHHSTEPSSSSYHRSNLDPYYNDYPDSPMAPGSASNGNARQGGSWGASVASSHGVHSGEAQVQGRHSDYASGHVAASHPDRSNGQRRISDPQARRRGASPLTDEYDATAHDAADSRGDSRDEPARYLTSNYSPWFDDDGW